MGTVNEGLFTSNTDEWGTPLEFFDMLNAEFRFTLDVCASVDNAKCERFFTASDDGLLQPWTGVCWMNPPYGKHIPDWMAKAYEESQTGAVVVCLIPCRTDTAYWHEYAMKAAEIRLVRGRLSFTGGHELTAHNAPFPCAVVVFRPGHVGFPSLSSIGRKVGEWDE